MYGLFNGLEIGKRTLLSSQLAMAILGHNMANINTRGHSRQRVSITSAVPVDSPRRNAGGCVEIKGIEHASNLFLAAQYRNENASRAYWDLMEKSVSQIEGYFNEHQDNSLGDSLKRFWRAWRELGDRPRDNASRISLVEEARSLINNFHRLDKQLKDLRRNMDSAIRNLAHQLNQYGARIADLNLQISHQEPGTEKANDLRDLRDLLIDELSQFVDIRVVEREKGQTAVLTGETAFVDGSDFLSIGTRVRSGHNITTTKVVRTDSDVEIKSSNGGIAAMFEVRDKVIPRYQQAVDRLAQGVVENVNEVHRSRYGLRALNGHEFFDPHCTDAAHINLDTEILNDVDQIAASTPEGPDYGSNALALAKALNGDRVMSNDSSAICEYYDGIVGRLDIELMESTNYKTNYSLLVQQIENHRQSAQGVTLDEEMAKLIRFQDAYDAAARVITAMDQALDTLINETNVVGR